MTSDTRADPPPALYSRDAARANLDRFADEQVYGVCPDAEAFDPAAAAAQYWEQAVRPPTPEPLAIAPGSAVTGLPAYLVIGGDPAPEWSLGNPIGADIVISATPRYVVDWGDGTTTETASRGRPYPGGPGEVTHTYRYAGDLEVTVSAYWTGTWRLAGQAPGSGQALGELVAPTVGRLALPVGDIQAIRQR